MYVLVRRDLSPSQQTVQSCHAVAEFMLHHGHKPCVRKWAGDDRFLIALGVKDLAELKDWQMKLKQKGMAAEAFVEPDIGDQETALAVHPTSDRSLFKKLRLL